ncbi:YiiX family permuted papain-like enzyme [Flavobacterium pedocola]
MKKLLLLVITAFITVSFIGYFKFEKAKESIQQSQALLKDGDIIFQTSVSEQCEAIRIATNSKYSHCGIIYVSDGKKYVLEAVQPVTITPFEEWIKHGEGRKYLVKRLKNAETVLTPAVISKMKEKGELYLNKDYDLYFNWSDDRIYCSELVWKIYKNGAGIELCPFQELKDFNLNDPKVQKILKQRYGNAIPYNEKVIAPSQIEKSAILETVIDTY